MTNRNKDKLIKEEIDILIDCVSFYRDYVRECLVNSFTLDDETENDKIKEQIFKLDTDTDIIINKLNKLK